MHEGGAAKLARDKLFFQIVSALRLVEPVNQPGRAQALAASVPARMKLLAVNLQTVDQVPFTFPFPFRSALIVFLTFGSNIGT